MKTIIKASALLLIILLSACQSVEHPVERDKTIEYGSMGLSYTQDGKDLDYDSVRLELLRNYRSRSSQVEVNKWENKVTLQVLSGVLLVPLPFYLYHDAQLRRAAVEAYNESIELQEILVDVESWEAAGFIQADPQGDGDEK